MSGSSPNPFERYSRQMILPGIGEKGQRALADARVAVVGSGALGCGVLDQLARAGVGQLTLIDRDVIEWSNLQRQTLFGESDALASVPKAIAAASRIRAINSAIAVTTHIADLTAENAEELLWSAGKPTVVLDGTDNLFTRYLLNDITVKHAIPLVYGGVIARRGMQMTIRPGNSPCLRCVFPEPGDNADLETCETAGVLGAAVGIVTSLQAAAAIDLVTGAAEGSPPLLSEFDLGTRRFRTIDLSNLASPEVRQACICCGQHRYEFLSGARSRGAVTLCGRGAFQIPAGSARIDLARLAGNIARISPVQANEFFVRVMPRSGVEMTVFADARAVIRGVGSEGEARALYDRFVGA